MIKQWKPGLAALVTVGLATAVYAQVHYNNYRGQDGGTYVNLYSNFPTNSLQYAKVDVTDPNNRGATLSWSTSTNSGSDYVGAVGWEKISQPRNFYYGVSQWRAFAVGDNAVFGAYGWDCDTGKPWNIEFYIVEAWFASGTFVPRDTNNKELPNRGNPVKLTQDGKAAQYNIYSDSSDRNFADACGNNTKPFRQIWAVRTAKRSVGKTAVTLQVSTMMNRMKQEADYPLNGTFEYIVMGIDGFRGSKGDVGLTKVDRD